MKSRTAATASADAAPRSTTTAVFVGLAVAVAGAAVAGCLFTIPLFALARFTEPAHGTGREWFTTGLRWAAGLGVVAGLVVGTVTAWWYREGYTLPESPPPSETP